MGRLPSFSQILYKDFMYFRVRGNNGHTSVPSQEHVIGRGTSQYGQTQKYSAQ